MSLGRWAIRQAESRHWAELLTYQALGRRCGIASFVIFPLPQVGQAHSMVERIGASHDVRRRAARQPRRSPADDVNGASARACMHRPEKARVLAHAATCGT